MLKKIAYSIRHLPVISKAEWIWNILRKPYHSLLNFSDTGVTVNYRDDDLKIKIPPQYYSVHLTEYEKKATSKLISWIKNYQDCFIIDIGCANGLLSAICLFTSEKCEVIGIDSDLASLKASQLMTKYASGDRFGVVNGLISENSSSSESLNEVFLSTKKSIKESNLTGNPKTTKYINLDKNQDGKIPIYTIDHLFKNHPINQTHKFIKCDVEGAELFVLRGAINFIQKYQPIILLSVHPDILPLFNCSVEAVKKQLDEINYTYMIIDIDHEEHWWCTAKI